MDSGETPIYDAVAAELGWSPFGVHDDIELWHAEALDSLNLGPQIDGAPVVDAPHRLGNAPPDQSRD